MMLGKITKINDTTYCIEEFGGMVYGYLLLGEKRAALIDTGAGFLDYRKATDKITDMPVDVILTHGHLDHISSNHRFERVYIHPADETVCHDHASYETRLGYMEGLLQEMKLPEKLIKSKPVKKLLDKICILPSAGNLCFAEEGTVIDLGGRPLEIIHTPGHTPGSVCILDIDHRELYTGDTVCDEGILLHLEHCCSVHTFLNSIQKLKACAGRYDRMWPGHHKKPIDHSFLDEYVRCAEKIIAEHPENSTEKADGLEAFGRIKISFTTDNI